MLAPLDFSAIPGSRWCSSHFKDEKPEAHKIGHWPEPTDLEITVPTIYLLLQPQPVWSLFSAGPLAALIPGLLQHSQEKGKQDAGRREGLLSWLFLFLR